MKRPFILILTFVMLISLFLAACSNNEEAGNETDNEDPFTEETNEEEEGNTGGGSSYAGVDLSEFDVSTITEFNQSPFFDDRDLPPVEERLPLIPKVANEQPPEFLDYQIGKYGGQLDTVTSMVDWDADVFVMGNEPLLNTPGIQGDTITGNILEGYETNDDYTEFTFYLREGLKWSDGEPVTMEDVQFAVEDVIFNEDLTPTFPAWLRSAGESDGTPMEFEVIDDWSFKLSFDEPYGGLLIRLAIQGWRGYHDFLKPAHYLKQFHKDYVDEADMIAMLEEHEYEPDMEQWVSLFGEKDIVNSELSSSLAIGFPVLYPWIVVSADNNNLTFERNPYYFKVDPEGNQLPYIDTILSTYVQDPEMVGLKVIAGEVDFARETTALVKMPLYRENAEQGGYEALLTNMHVNPSDFFLNLTNEDPVWREVVQDVRFRQALNYAIDREEIIESLYFGYAEPADSLDSTFDIEKANQLLDEMGMEMGPDGFRLGPDGNRFTIPFEHGGHGPDFAPLGELLVQMFEEIGIHATVKQLDQALWSTRNAANELKATIIWTHPPLWYMADWGQGYWAPTWNSWWNSGGNTGEEPPEEVKEFYQLVNQINILPPEEAIQAMDDIKANMKENVWYFTHITNVKQPLIVNENIRNITDKGFAIGVNFSGEILYFDE